MEAIEIDVKDMGFNEAIEYARDNTYSEVKNPDVILLVDDLEIHKKGIENLYYSLPIGVPFNKELNDKINKIETIRSITLNNKTYNNWLEIVIQPFGSVYFVEKIKE